MKNSEITALIARVEAGQSLQRDEVIGVLRDFLQVNRQLIKARDAGYVIPAPKKQKPDKKHPR